MRLTRPGTKPAVLLALFILVLTGGTVEADSVIGEPANLGACVFQSFG